MKKFTVTIGIPAFNEEKGIVRVLDSIYAQKHKNYTLEKVYIANDGSTDSTVDLVKKFAKKHPTVKLINDGKRLGQAGRLMQFYHLNTSDIFITFDADSVLAMDTVIEDLVGPFNDDKVGAVAGHDIPFPAKKFFEKIVEAGVNIWYEIRVKINTGDSIHNLHGCVNGLRKNIAKNIHYPKNLFAIDAYEYLDVKKQGYKFVMVPSASVYYRIADNLHDFLLQNSRYVDTQVHIEKLFSQNIYADHNPTLSQKIQGVLTETLRNPIYSILAIILQIVLRLVKPFYLEDSSRGIWTVVGKTKSL